MAKLLLFLLSLLHLVTGSLKRVSVIPKLRQSISSWSHYLSHVSSTCLSATSLSSSNPSISIDSFGEHIIQSPNPVAIELFGWDSNQQQIFFSSYWQRQPVLIRKAIPDIEKELGLMIPRDLLDLSLDDDVESRLLRRKGSKWSKIYGPFEQRDLDSLPQKDWTVLVQEVDRHVPSVADLWDKYFSHVPLWRRDDVMISYAAPGGGIGAHVDNYDVFLIQGKGRREWAIENKFVSHAEEERREVPNVDTRLLKDFVCGQSWDLEAGDMLYLPPRIPHRGVSLGEHCTTVSMGFRAPSYRSMMTAFCEHVCSKTISENDMYSDLNSPTSLLSPLLPNSSTEVKKEVSDSIRTRLTSYIDGVMDGEEYSVWLGKYLTTPLRMQLRQPVPFFLESFRKKVASTMDNRMTSRGGEEGSDVELEEEDEHEEDEDEEDEDEEELPLSVSSKHSVASSRIFPDVESLLSSMLKADDNIISLRRAEGIKIALCAGNMFINGDIYPIPANAAFVGPMLCDERVITSERLKRGLERCRSEGGSSLENSVIRLLAGLLRSGFWYPVDVKPH